MSVTDHLSLPLIAAAQSQKHVTHNEALLTLDDLTHLSVLSRSAALPGAGAVSGERRIVASGAQAGSVAVWRDGAWSYLSPRKGWRAYVEDEARAVVWTGAAWAAETNPVPMIGVNATADAATRLVVKSNASLFSHDDATPGDGHARLVVNKAQADRTASLLLQTNWSGRAELACEAGDAVALKTSADGALWRYALGADGAGQVAVGKKTPTAALDLNCADGGAFALSATNTALLMTQSDAGVDALTAQTDVNLRSAGLAASGGYVSFFRLSPSTGHTNLRVYRSVGTATINAMIGGNTATTYFAAAVGNVGVGTSAPHSKLTVAGVTAPFADNAYTLGASGYRWSSLYAATGVINTSDARLKRDVSDCPLGLSFVRALTPRLYRWVDGGAETRSVETPSQEAPGESEMRIETTTRPGRRLHAGLIAQDVKAALDKAGVDCGLWTLADPADPKSVQSLRYDQMIAPLVQAVKELADRLDAIEAKAARA